MKESTSRRSFLRTSVIVTSGIALLSSTSSLHALTAEETPFLGYNPYAETKTDLRTSSVYGKHITVKGKIFDPEGLVTRPNVLIEVWHLSPNSTKFRHRAKLRSNDNGEYSFITDAPSSEQGKNARIYFKISEDSKSYFTELVINNSGAYISNTHWEKNNQLGDKIFPKQETFLDQTTITFNFSI